MRGRIPSLPTDATAASICLTGAVMRLTAISAMVTAPSVIIAAQAMTKRRAVSMSGTAGMSTSNQLCEARRTASTGAWSLALLKTPSIAMPVPANCGLQRIDGQFSRGQAGNSAATSTPPFLNGSTLDCRSAATANSMARATGSMAWRRSGGRMSATVTEVATNTTAMIGSDQERPRSLS